MATEQEIRELKERHSPHLLRQAGVVGVGIEKDESSGGYALAVHVDPSNAKAVERLPKQIEGHRIKYVYSGPFRKFSRND